MKEIWPNMDGPPKNKELLSYAPVQDEYVLFYDALNTFYLLLYGVGHTVKDHWDSEWWTRCRHIGYSFRLVARVILYASFNRQDSTYYGLYYTSRGALAGTNNKNNVNTLVRINSKPSSPQPTACISGLLRRRNFRWFTVLTTHVQTIKSCVFPLLFSVRSFLV